MPKLSSSSPVCHDLTNTSQRYYRGTPRVRIVGGYSEEVPPLPIPNRAVKLLSADGTAPKRWESRSPPTFFYVSNRSKSKSLSSTTGFFCLYYILSQNLTCIASPNEAIIASYYKRINYPLFSIFFSPRKHYCRQPPRVY